MSDKYAVLRRDLPELVAEAKRQGGINPRAQLIIDLLAERDELAANTAPQPQQDVARLIICDECHDRCADPYTGLFASHCPDEEPCIMCECSRLRRQLAEQQPAPDVAELQAECEKWKRGSEIRDEQNQDLHSFIMELKDECEKLRAAMIEAKGHISHYMYGGSIYREPAAKAVALIDAALTSHREGGEA